MELLKWRKKCAVVLLFAMMLTLIPAGGEKAQAKSKVVQVKVGKKKTVKLSDISKVKKVKWSVKNKKIVKITKKSKKKVTIKGLKIGKTWLVAKIYSGGKVKSRKIKISVIKASEDQKEVSDSADSQKENTSADGNLASGAPDSGKPAGSNAPAETKSPENSTAPEISTSPAESETSASGQPETSNAPAESPTSSNAPEVSSASTETVSPAVSETPVSENPAVSSGTQTGNPLPSQASSGTANPAASTKWVSTWATAEEKCGLFNNNDAMPKLALKDTTVREIIRVTTAGNKIRFRLSNQYGESSVTIKSMHIAKQIQPDKPKIDTATDTKVTVDGKEEFTIPKGKMITTDETDFSVNALDNIAVSFYFGSTPTKNITGHRGARATTYQVKGNETAAETFTAPETTTSWFFLADASLLVPEEGRAVVCFGDSITDGYGTDAAYLGKKPDSYTRWADYFAKRLQGNEETKYVSVLNEGIGSNSILGAYPTDAGKDRFARDLLQHDGVAYCIILFGVNDLDKLQNTDRYAQLLPEYQKMVKLCHDNNIKVYGAPILPFGTSSYYSDYSEQVRTMINNWMRSADSQMDGIIDFESAVADPANPKNILKEYTHDDGLHPYDGYKVMADAIDLKMFGDVPSQGPAVSPKPTEPSKPIFSVSPDYTVQEMELSEVENLGTTQGLSYDAATGVLTAKDLSLFMMKLPQTVPAGAEVKVNIVGSLGGSQGFRSYLVPGVDVSVSNIVNSNEDGVVPGGPFNWTFTLTATDKATHIQFKGISYNIPIDHLEIQKITIAYQED